MRILRRISIICIWTSMFIYSCACTHTYTYICDKDCTQRKQSWSFFKAMIPLWIIMNDYLSWLWEGYASIMGFGRLSSCLNLFSSYQRVECFSEENQTEGSRKVKVIEERMRIVSDRAKHTLFFSCWILFQKYQALLFPLSGWLIKEWWSHTEQVLKWAVIAYYCHRIKWHFNFLKINTKNMETNQADVPKPNWIQTGKKYLLLDLPWLHVGSFDLFIPSFSHLPKIMTIILIITIS